MHLMPHDILLKLHVSGKTSSPVNDSCRRHRNSVSRPSIRLWLKGRVGSVEETSKSKLDFESVQPPPPPFRPLSKATPPQNTQTRTAGQQLEDESTRERWGALSSLTVSDYLMSHSHDWKHRTSSHCTQTTNMVVVSTQSVTFQALQLPQFFSSLLKIHTDVDSGLTSRFIQPLLLSFFSFSAILVQLVR